MRFGVCAAIESAPVLAQCGYNYIELSVAADLLPDQSESDWASRRSKIESMGLPVEAFNSFIRVGKVVGPDVDSVRIRSYVSTALARAAKVGGSVIVFGSGGARSIPDGWPLAQAYRQLVEFLNYCADAYEETGVIVVVEPLCRAECNVINLVSDGAALVREVARPGVLNLADTYHMEAEAELLSAIADSADVLAHAHTADTGRLWPGSGSYNHKELFRALKSAGFDNRLSIECSWQGKLEDHAGTALEHLRGAYAMAMGTR